MSCLDAGQYVQLVQVNKADVKYIKLAVEVDLNFPSYLAE